LDTALNQQVIEDIDWSLAARQLVRAVRGRRSQVAFSRRLGYRSNPVGDWEVGRRFPTASEFFRVCNRGGIDIMLAAERFRPDVALSLGDGDDAGIAEWLSALKGTASIQEVAERCGRTRYVVGRWLGGVTRPRLPEFLGLVDVLTGQGPEFVARVVDPGLVPALELRLARMASLRGLALEEPWTQAVRFVIESTAYRAQRRHVSGWIGRQLGLGNELEARCLGLMEAAGVIIWASGKFEINDPPVVDMRIDPAVRARVRSHWADISRERVDIPLGEDFHGGVVFCGSKAHLVRAKLILREALDQIAESSGEACEVDEVFVVQVALVDLLGPGKTSSTRS
jgi:hypothetical protein